MLLTKLIAKRRLFLKCWCSVLFIFICTRMNTPLLTNWISGRASRHATDLQEVTLEKSLGQSIESAGPDVHNMQGSDGVVEDLKAQQRIDKGSKYHIVLYHFYHTMLKWKGKDVDMSKCSLYKNCEVRHQNKCSDEPIDADAIVFQGNNMPADIPRRVNSGQVFVYVNIESPQYLQSVQLTGSKLQDFFNWTMSYRFDSDIPYLYGSIIPRIVSNDEVFGKTEKTSKIYNYRDFLNFTTQWPHRYKGIPGKDYEAIFKRKTKSSVWFVSHCGTASKREKFVENMKKVTKVDIFGRCSPIKNICPKSQKNCNDVMQESYKFVLAFENSLCEDYVTEKVFSHYDKDMITVVFGAHNYTKYLPEGTYIDANDFASPEELAEYLNYVGYDKEMYLGYLKLKDQYKAISEKDHVQLAYCTLCYRLNKLNEYRKPGSPLKQWWDRPGICNNPTILDTKFRRPR